MELRRKRLAAAARRVQAVYNLSEEQRQAILAVQGGKCAICQEATGRTKALAVDHDHTCCQGKTSCGRCVRGLLCSNCNDVLALAHDNPQFFYNAIRYLSDWPSLRAGI